MQTPNDGDSFCSLAITAKNTSHHGIMVSSYPEKTLSPLLNFKIDRALMNTDLPMVYLPIEFLKLHVKDSKDTLATLNAELASIEEKVGSEPSDDSNKTDFGPLIKQLHSLNSRLIKLQRRWHFQTALSSAIIAFLGYYATSTKSYNAQGVTFNAGYGGTIAIEHLTSNVSIDNPQEGPLEAIAKTPEFRILRDSATLQSKLSLALEYDLNVLPKRIKNQSAAVSYKTPQKCSFYKLTLTCTRFSTSCSREILVRRLRIVCR
jgi:hypothetical protein